MYRPCGRLAPKKEMVASLGPGEIGFFTAAIKQVADTRVGDTVTDEKNPAAEALPDFKEAQSVVFAGFFPVDAAKFEDLREAMGRLRLDDASFSFDMETSAALGFGFRCGFLGLLILKSPANASSVSSMWISSPRRRASSTRSTCTRHAEIAAQSGRHAGSNAD